MDKRWIAILFIIIIACGCGYYIIKSSSTVGNAIADVNTHSVTLPYGFSVGHSESNSIALIDKNTNEKIYIKDVGKGDSAASSFNSNLKKLSKEKEVINNTTKTTDNNVVIYIAHYVDLNNESLKNQSIAYYYTYGHTFQLKLSGFNDISNLDDKITFIADTTHPDYKKPQDTDDTQEQSDLAVNYKREVKSQD